ncbi:MAG: glycoside hydrolase family 5 protein [Spirochaetales bacterium]|nr:glycoside hydrolase family 5 protein [Spirochaetales bacterium]
MLQVSKNHIVDEQGKTVRLRGVCIGGWMNMENFINGYPGDEHGLRAVMAEVLGPGKAAFFFDRWLDRFLAEEDIAFIESCGANVVRLPLNYRHFESDGEPFRYLEEGFARLDRAVQWCGKHGLFAILDLHAVQGWQNTDWHSDNSSRQTLFWRHPYFQDRFVALWEELARRYKGNGAVAGYNLMNEPVTNAPAGRFSEDRDYRSDWETFNRVYRRVVEKIRAIDPDHIVFLEGDLFSTRFEKLEAPFAENLAYSSHNYTFPAYDPSRTPVTRQQRDENVRRQRELFLAHEGTKYARKYGVPLWVGEFGSTGDSTLEDQVRVFEEQNAHWTFWTYKGCGVMSFMNVAPDSEYQRLLAPVMKAKRDLGVDTWLLDGVPGSTVGGAIGELARLIEAALPDAGIDPAANRRFLAQTALGGYTAALMQPAYAKRFKGLSEEKLDDVLQSFALKNCRPWEKVLSVLKKYWTGSRD